MLKLILVFLLFALGILFIGYTVKVVNKGNLLKFIGLTFMICIATIAVLSSIVLVF